MAIKIPTKKPKKLRPLKVKQNIAKREVEIEGIRYSYEIFEQFAWGPLGEPFVMLKREDGVIEIARWNPK